MAIETAVPVAPAIPATVVSSGTLFSLTIRAGGKTARSRILAAEAATKHNAEVDSIYTSVRKLAKESTKTLDMLASKARYDIFYKNTVPWDAAGYRYCPTALIPKLLSEIRDVDSRISDAVEDMLEDYDAMKADYHARVGKVLATEVPFPSKEELRESYGVLLTSMPLRDVSDWRLNNIDARTMQRLRDEVSQQMAEKVEDASYHVLEQLQKVVGNVVEIVSKESGSRIHASLIGNVRDLCEVGDALNIAKDPEVARLLDRARNLTNIDHEDLRATTGNQQLRKETVKEASSILADIRRFGL